MLPKFNARQALIPQTQDFLFLHNVFNAQLDPIVILAQLPQQEFALQVTTVLQVLQSIIQTLVLKDSILLQPLLA